MVLDTYIVACPRIKVEYDASFPHFNSSVSMSGREEKKDAPAWEKHDLRRYEMVNTQTGEVVDALPVLVPRRRKMGQPFFMAMQRGLRDLATDPDLTHDARRVLLYMLSKMEYDNHIRVGQAEIARVLGIDKSRVSRAVKILDTRKVLISPTKIGRSTVYRLDAFYGWKGKARDLPRVSRDRRGSDTTRE